MATNLNIVIGKGNLGAVGIRLRGAQGSGIEDVTVNASVPLVLIDSYCFWRVEQTEFLKIIPNLLHVSGDGLAGVVGGCGSGGAHHGLHVIGGRYGLDLRQSQPTGTVSGTTLQGQRCAALIYVRVIGFMVVQIACNTYQFLLLRRVDLRAFQLLVSI